MKYQSKQVNANHQQRTTCLGHARNLITDGIIGKRIFLRRLGRIFVDLCWLAAVAAVDAAFAGLAPCADPRVGRS